MENRDDAVMSGLFILHECCCGRYGAVGGRGVSVLTEKHWVNLDYYAHRAVPSGEGMHRLRSSQKAERGHVN